MRTTIRINDAVLQAAKREAVERHISLTKLIEEALQEKLSAHHKHTSNRFESLVYFKGDGLQPGIDLDDSASLLDLMEA